MKDKNLFMKSFLCIIAALTFVGSTKAQDLYSGVGLAVKGTASLYVSGNFTNAATSSYLNDATVYLKGNITNAQASMSSGSGTTHLNGSAAQTISGTQPFVVNLSTINNSAGGTSGITVSNTTLTFAGNVTFTNGRIGTTGTGKASFRDNVTYSGSSNASHISGLAEKIGDDAFTFPVGDGIMLRPAALGAPSAVTDVFNAQYLHANSDLIWWHSSRDASLTKISLCEYWVINQTAGSSNVTATLTWDNAYSCGITSLPDLKIARYNGTKWKDEGNGGTTGTVSAGTIVSAAVQTGYGPYTLASIITTQLPIMLVNFDAVYNKQTKDVDLTWYTASEINNDYFTIERSKDAINFEELKRVKGAGNSTQMLSYKDVDENPYMGKSFYRLRQTDFNGSYTYSDIREVNISDLTTVNDFVYPNPTENVVNVTFEDIQSLDPINVKLFDNLGQIVIDRNFYPQNLGANKLSIDMLHVAQGVYHLTLGRANEEVKSFKIVKN